jgi:hypothetical protein
MSNVIDKITIEFENGDVTVVEPGDRQSIILSLDRGERITQFVNVKLSELCGLLDTITYGSPVALM